MIYGHERVHTTSAIIHITNGSQMLHRGSIRAVSMRGLKGLVDTSSQHCRNKHGTRNAHLEMTSRLKRKLDNIGIDPSSSKLTESFCLVLLYVPSFTG